MDINEQPTQPWHGDQLAPGDIHSQQQDTPSSATQKSARRVGGLSRRKLFIGLAGVGTAAAVGGGVALEQWIQHGGLKPALQGPLSTNVQIGHLLRRAGFGGTPQELSSYAALGYNGTVDRLINYQQVSDDALEQRLKSLNLDFTKPLDQQRWWLLRMAWTLRPLLEKMTLFWSGHFTSSFRDVGKARDRMITQNQFLRNHAFDTFDNLLLGITADPAMLVYLNLTQSRKKVPNENYARELMELFTLGLGHYTQQDVYEAAAALTGWHVVGQTATSEYLENTHNNELKTYLGHMGDLDYKDVINILANHPATPWFICRKLFTFFAYENPSDDDLKPLVDTYVKSNHNMGEVLAEAIVQGLGLRIGYVTLGGFDTHVGQVQRHDTLMITLAEGLSAFYQDLTQHGKADNVVIMTWSEFGWRVEENGSLGTDHGTAAPLFVLGNAVNKGIYGEPPALNNLDNTGNLKYTVDFRSVYATVLDRWVGASSKDVLGDTFDVQNFLPSSTS